MEEFLNEIGIVQKGNISDDGCYVIDFASDREWSQAQSKLDRSDLVAEEEDSTVVSMETVVLQYVNDEYNITLSADFNADQYRLVMREV